VKALREQHRLSRREAAERLGIGRDHLASIERGEENLTLPSVERLADGLGVDVYVLIAENDRAWE
jgi:transcriptional regulator with XRE-family HTH domain